MGRLTISLTDEIIEDLRATKPSHRPMSQHIADLLVEGLSARQEQFGKTFSQRVAKIAVQQAWKNSLPNE
jgi:tRNA(Met) C34 N-acetyltransferase TmcA